MQDNRQRQLFLVLIVVGAGLAAYSYFMRPGQHAAGSGAAATSNAAGAGAGASKTKKQAARQVAPGQPTVRAADPAHPTLSPAQRVRLARTATIHGDSYVATVSNLNAAVTRFDLTGDKFHVNGRPMNLVTTDREQYQPLRPDIGGVTIPPDAVWDMQQVSAREVRFTWRGDGVSIERKLEAGRGPYQLWSTVRIRNERNYPRRVRVNETAFHYVTREQESGGFFAARSPLISHGICYDDDTVHRVDRSAGVEGAHRYAPGVFAGVENTFFTLSLAADSPEHAEACRVEASDRGNADDPAGSLFTARLVYAGTDIAPGAAKSFRTLAYLGPKAGPTLAMAGHSLPQAIDLGWFSLIATQLVRLLGAIHEAVGNWGIAIILLTILVKLVLFPLTFKSFSSMARMRKLKPEIDRINELYKDDREKKGAATMELYRKQKINPLGGCLPTLLQLPVWWALYTSLATNIELFHSRFIPGWLNDLSAPDPVYALPLALGALMYVQQAITPTTMDPVQAKMMKYVMPITFTVFMLFLPSGLCLYMFTNSALGIGQQKLIEWYGDRNDPKPAAVAMTAAGGGGGDPSAGEDEEDDGDDEDRASPPRRPSKLPKTASRRSRRG